MTNERRNEMTFVLYAVFCGSMLIMYRQHLKRSEKRSVDFNKNLLEKYLIHQEENGAET